ncbi:MAG: sodium:calcium antiporter [Bacillota bacterium]
MLVLHLTASIVIILLGARFFTNGVEWLGVQLGLARGAVGSILAALGTALPETMIPIAALLRGRGEAAAEIGIGAILGAPFMLSTAGLALAGGTALVCRRGGRLIADRACVGRDLCFFFLAYTTAILAAFLPGPLRTAVVVVLLGTYLLFFVSALTRGARCGEGEQLAPLLVAPRLSQPPLPLVFGQVFFAFGLIMGGARVFVEAIGWLAQDLGVPVLVFSLLLAPLATEMPELLNSVLWLREGKDTLALGNITGAMVFQSAIVPCLGIAFTPWELTPAALTSALLALGSAALAYFLLVSRGHLSSFILFVTGTSCYLVFFAAMLLLGLK